MCPLAIPALTVACLLFVHAPAARAQALVGVSEVKLIVEQLDDEARECGVTPDGLEAAVRITLANSRLRVLDGLGEPYYYVQVNVIRGGEQCIASVRASVSRSVWLTPTGPKLLAQVWSKGLLTAHSRRDFGRRLNSSVEDLTKLMLGAWLKDNQR